MARDPELLAHQQWLGYLQPVGLVVSPPALLQAQAHVNLNIAAEHQRFLDHAHEALIIGRPEPVPAIKNLRALLLDVFGWQAGDLVEASDPRAMPLEVFLSEYHESLRPTFAVPDDPRATPPTWLLFIQELAVGTPLDEVVTADHRGWQATPHARFERLLRETQVPIGLLSNATHLRLVYAPRGETAGHLTFPVQAMTEVAGRPIFAALHMLLGADRLFALPDKQRLPAILAESRKYQNTVSTELAKQVLAALFELLRGFQAADDQRKGELLREVLERDPDQVYAGLLTVLLRLVFLLYGEDRGLMSDDEVYVKHYSVTGLFERLRADAGRYPDTMDLRYGAWAQLLALFRMVHDGGRHGKLHLPARHGYLFNPDRYPFLEGRPPGSQRERGQRLTLPLVADGVIFRVLHNLLVLDGERISYRSLDVEQIGSVYETVMGFRLEKAGGRSIAIKPAKAHGAPVTINLEALLQVPAKDRGKWVKEQAGQALTGTALNELKAADTAEALVAALERKVARDLTPNIVPPGGMVLQPSDERRRSGSHYTPRSLTEPIVRKALEPVAASFQLAGPAGQAGSLPPRPEPVAASFQLAGPAGQAGSLPPRPEAILALKVCDPAMGSGAFLVEACRQLGDVLVAAWHAHHCLPTIPSDEDELLHARRLVAQRCLYGVDKNPMAVDLAKLSLWLATLAKDRPFTFLDHALRCGDSLVGLTREQIIRFHWKEGPQQQILGAERVTEALTVATRTRQEILDAGDAGSFDLKQQKLAAADGTLNLVRFAGNLVVAAFFGADKDRQRQERRDELLGQLTEYLRTGNMNLRPGETEKRLRAGAKGVTPFHWQIEFPEVFGRENAGFDCIVGNPPFMGGTMISTNLGESYKDWLYSAYSESGNRMDLVAYFFRAAFGLTHEGGAFGLIATNTIAQGDTRKGGLRFICTHGGTIYTARRRMKWPGLAAVTVSVIHIQRGKHTGPYQLDDNEVRRVTAFLFHRGDHEDPAPLAANKDLIFEGFKLAGQGFLFDDKDEAASPLAEMHRLMNRGLNRERIFPYIGGEEVNDSPTHAFHRHAIDFADMTLERIEAEWPELLAVVREKVKPHRDSANRDAHRERWWQYGEKRPGLRRAIRNLPRVQVIARVSQHLAPVFLPNGMIYSEQLEVLALPTYAAFCTLHSRVHEVWARFFASSLEDRLRYTPSDCFETFPFPVGWDPDPDTPGSRDRNPNLQAAGKEYYEFRTALMVRNNEGLTKTYNRFHDRLETSPDIHKLRELHAAMDRAVLDAYGWTDLKPTCEFLLDYEEDEDEEETGGRQRKKPWRYRWPDDFRDEVLARLLELNKQRAEEEALAGAAVKPKKGDRKRAQRQRPQAPGLF
jgi:hypothetical protein